MYVNFNFQLAFDIDRDTKDHNAYLDGMVSEPGKLLKFLKKLNFKINGLSNFFTYLHILCSCTFRVVTSTVLKVYWVEVWEGYNTWSVQEKITEN